MAKTNTWTTSEIQTFLGILGEDAIQQELDGAVRNEKVFAAVAERMAKEGFCRSSEQCRMKCKKMKQEYRKYKDMSNRSGSGKKTWKWFNAMDAIYGHRPANQGREAGRDSAISLLEAMMVDDEGKLCSCHLNVGISFLLDV